MEMPTTVRNGIVLTARYKCGLFGHSDNVFISHWDADSVLITFAEKNVIRVQFLYRTSIQDWMTQEIDLEADSLPIFETRHQ